MKNLMNITDLTVEEIDELIAVAEDIIANPVKYQDACRHKLLATLFFEPSTRTRLSFESAMQEVADEYGMNVYSVVDVYDIIEYLEEDEANRENVERIKNYLAVNGAKA